MRHIDHNSYKSIEQRWECSTITVVVAEVEAPSGRRSPVQIKDNGDGTVTINYQPTEVGLHNLHVFYNDEPLEGVY